MKNSEIKKLLETFTEVARIRILLVDSKFRAVEDTGYYNEEFCSHIHNSKKCLTACINSDKHGFRRVSETGEPYKYLCPFGIFQGIVPIKKSGKPIHYLFMSSVIEEKPENDWKKIINKVREVDDGLNTEILLESIGKMVIYPGKKLEACFDMLCMLGEYIGNNVTIDLKEKTLAETVKDYIDNNFDKRITLAKLSAVCHYSTVSITEHFYKEYGQTVIDYLLKKRISFSETLLEQTNMQVKEIAEKCGFSDSEYFRKCFKKVKGIPPGQWKKIKGVS